jgi:hypothetical protein
MQQWQGNQVRAHLNDDPDPDDHNHQEADKSSNTSGAPDPACHREPGRHRRTHTYLRSPRTASQTRSAKLRGPLTKTKQSSAFVRSQRDGEVSRTDLRYISGPLPRCFRRRQPLPRCWCRRLPCRFRARSDASGLAGEATSEVR